MYFGADVFLLSCCEYLDNINMEYYNNYACNIFWVLFVFRKNVIDMNKTKLLALASAVTVTAVSVFASNASAVQMPMLGDMDNSGKVGASDARTILRHVARLEKIDESILSAADTDGDGKITASDARTVLRYASKLDRKMGGEKKYSELVSSVKASEAALSSQEETVEPTRETTLKPTEPSTVKPTEKKTTPTTARPTQPTTEKPTVPTAEAESSSFFNQTTQGRKINENIPKEIRSYLEGKFDYKGMMYSGENGRTFISYVSDGTQMKVLLSDSDGKTKGILKTVKKNTFGKDVFTYYYINENAKTYCPIPEILLKSEGISFDNFDLTYLLYENFTVSDSSVNTNVKTVCYKFETEGSVIKFHMDGDELIGVEECNKTGEIKSMTLFDYFNSEVTAGSFELTDYTKVSIIDIFKEEPTTSEATSETPADETKTNPAVTETTTKKEIVTEPVSRREYDENLPEDIKSYLDNTFIFEGQIISSGGTQNVRYTVYGDNFRLGMNSDGLSFDLMKLTEKNIITKKSVSKFYLVKDNTYIILDKSAMKMLGISEDDFDFPGLVNDISGMECTTSVTGFNGIADVICYKFSSESSAIKFYMNGESLIGVQTLDSDGNIITTMIFDSFSGEVPPSAFSLDGYKKMTMIQFVSKYS